MIVYEATKGEFCDSVLVGSITDEIEHMYLAKIGKSPESQIRSWRNSMVYMFWKIQKFQMIVEWPLSLRFQQLPKG